jgi:hypothetical protein
MLRFADVLYVWNKPKGEANALIVPNELDRGQRCAKLIAI